MSRNYAIKILFGDHAGDTRMRSRFAREAEAVSRLNHANVIAVVDFGETSGGLLYLVMDLAIGESLAALMIREAPMAPSRAVAIMAKLAKGLEHAHRQGLVHRDFKGENVIMVTEEEQEVPKIVDFGICMIVEDSPSSTMLTSNGMVMGTPAMMAPEQASGDHVDHRTDLFSLGIVGYQMLSGCLPFEGTPLDMARKNLYEEIPSIAERSGVQVDPALETIIHKLTAKNPDNRYQSAKDALNDLRMLDAAGQSQDWNILTEIPTPVPQRPSGPHTGPGTNADLSGNFAQSRSTPMTSAMLGHTQFTPASRRKTPLVLGLAALAVAVGAAVGLVGRGDAPTRPVAAVDTAPRSDSASKTASGSEAPNDSTTAPDDPTTAPVAANAGRGTDVEATTKSDPSTAPDDSAKDDTVEAVTAPEIGPKTSPRQTSKNRNAKNRGRRKNNRKNKSQTTRKNKTQTNASTGAATLDDTKRLYSSVGSALDHLEATKGKEALRSLRRDYNDISFSRLLREASMQPVYHQSLLRLRSKIRAQRNK